MRFLEKLAKIASHRPWRLFFRFHRSFLLFSKTMKNSSSCQFPYFTQNSILKRKQFSKTTLWWNKYIIRMTDQLPWIFPSIRDCTLVALVVISISLPLADPRGAPGTRAPPGGPNSFIFMQFSAKIINKHTHFGSWRPPNPRSATVYQYFAM